MVITIEAKTATNDPSGETVKVTIQSAGDVDVTATGKVTVHAGGDAEVKSTGGKVTVEGTTEVDVIAPTINLQSGTAINLT